MDFVAAIRGESDRFYAIADGADPERPVPCCPDWNLADLVWHLGEVHWFWSTIIETRADKPDDVEALKPPRPGNFRDLIGWGRSQVDFLVRVLGEHDDDVPVWTWALQDADHSVGFIRRHQVQEAAVHRVDMEQAAGVAVTAVDPEVAADSIDELLAITVPWVVREEKPLSGSVHLHCTDTAGEWLVHPDGRFDRMHAKGDVALRGTASDLLLTIYKRLPPQTVEVFGDAALATEFLTRVDTA